MKSRKTSPTRGDHQVKDRFRDPVDRRAKPDIWVRSLVETRWGSDSQFHHATLRNKAGYLYLQWRAGDRVHSYYLGKAPKPSPTVQDPSPAPAGARGSRSRRGKK